MKNEKKYTLSAQRLQEALNDAGLIAQDLANKSGIAKASISHYLNGYYCPTLKKAKKLSEILNVSPAWLMGFDVPKHDLIVRKDGVAPDLMLFQDGETPLLVEVMSPSRAEIDKRLDKYSEKELKRFLEFLDLFDKMNGGD